jgi:hypothetical protein
MHIWCIRISIVLVLRLNSRVEASAGGRLVPDGLYSPVASTSVLTLKYEYELNCLEKK